MAVRDHGRGAEQYMHRFPDGMKDRIKAAADANGRSMAAEINARLELSFEPERSIHPKIARLINQHVDAEVRRKLQDIAAKIGGAS